MRNFQEKTRGTGNPQRMRAATTGIAAFSLPTHPRAVRAIFIQASAAHPLYRMNGAGGTKTEDDFRYVGYGV